MPKKNPSTAALTDFDDPLTLTKITSMGRDSAGVHSTEDYKKECLEAKF